MRAAARRVHETGSAMVMAMFVLSLLTGIGIGLLAVTQLEMGAHQAAVRAKVAFYLGEAGLEDGRDTLRRNNEDVGDSGTLDDELAAAAGPNGVIDFDPDTLRVEWNATGHPVRFTGFGDDVPLRIDMPLGGGLYAAFLTNDALDGRTSLNDTNDRLQVVGAGAGPGRALSVVQGVVERGGMPALPAAITLLGPDPYFTGGAGTLKLLTGDDCNGAGIPGLSMSVVGTLGAAAEAAAESGVEESDTYRQGAERGIDTVDDVSATIDPSWTDCNYLRDLARDVRDGADVVGDSATPLASFGTPANPKTVFIDGSYTVSSNFSGAGLLWVTGKLHVEATARFDWQGVIFVVGRGEFRRLWRRDGDLSGAALVANISGPDRVLWTGDDCSGRDGVPGNADDPFDVPTWDVKGESDATTAYCSTDISRALKGDPFRVAQFRQR